MPVGWRERRHTAVRVHSGVCVIHIERFNGPIFFISAENDEIWPSLRMSTEMVNYLKAHNFNFQVRHDTYPTGHGFSKEVAPMIKQSVVDRFLDTL